MSPADQFWTAVIAIMASLVLVMLAVCGLLRVAIWWLERKDRRRPVPDWAALRQAIRDVAADDEIERVVEEFRAELDDEALESWLR